MAKAKYESLPFFMKVTDIKETYVDQMGKSQVMDLPLISLPAGTVLFRGVVVPLKQNGEDIRYFYRDFLGTPEGENAVCMNAVHNVFFYPFPLLPFGAHGIGSTFHSIQAVVLVHPITVVCMVSPSIMVRGAANVFKGTAPVQRCDSIYANNPNSYCHKPNDREYGTLKYDNCLNPTYAIRSGTRGWMAIADLDSLNSAKQKKEGIAPENNPMSKHLLHLEEKFPGSLGEYISHLYTDGHYHIGFPELALYPYKNHYGLNPIKRICRNTNDAIRWMQKEAEKDNFLYLPLAVFTKDATIDMVNGLYSYDRLEIAANFVSTAPADHQVKVEEKVREYVRNLETKGITLPYYGKGKLRFDTRTGFFVLPQVVPDNLMVSVPPNPEDPKPTTIEPYRFLLKKLESEDDKRMMLKYRNIFRSFIPERNMKIYGLAKEYGLRRAMVFNRPASMKFIFDLIKQPAKFSDEFKRDGIRAGQLFQKETGKQPKAKPVSPKALKESSGPALGGEVVPAYLAGTPPLGGAGGVTPPYGSAAGGGGGVTPPLFSSAAAAGGGTPEFYRTPTPPLGAAGGAASPLYAPSSPPYVPVSPPALALGAQAPALALGDAAAPLGAAGGLQPPAPLRIAIPKSKGGARKTRSKSKLGRTKTRKTTPFQYATKFSEIWKAFAKQKQFSSLA